MSDELSVVLLRLVAHSHEDPETSLSLCFLLRLLKVRHEICVCMCARDD